MKVKVAEKYQRLLRQFVDSFDRVERIGTVPGLAFLGVDEASGDRLGVQLEVQVVSDDFDLGFHAALLRTDDHEPAVAGSYVSEKGLMHGQGLRGRRG